MTNPLPQLAFSSLAWQRMALVPPVRLVWTPVYPIGAFLQQE